MWSVCRRYPNIRSGLTISFLGEALSKPRPHLFLLPAVFFPACRGAGTSHKTARVKPPRPGSSAAAAAAAAATPSSRGSEQAAGALSSAATCESLEGERGSGGLVTSGGAYDDEDEDDTGVRVGCVATVEKAGRVVASTTTAEGTAFSPNSGGSREEATAVENRGGKRGAGGGADNNAKKDGSSRGGAVPRKKKVHRRGLYGTAVDCSCKSNMVPFFRSSLAQHSMCGVATSCGTSE